MLNLEITPAEQQMLLNFMKSAVAGMPVTESNFDEVIDAYVHHRNKVANARPAPPPAPPSQPEPVIPVKPAKSAK